MPAEIKEKSPGKDNLLRALIVFGLLLEVLFGAGMVSKKNLILVRIITSAKKISDLPVSQLNETFFAGKTCLPSTRNLLADMKSIDTVFSVEENVINIDRPV